MQTDAILEAEMAKPQILRMQESGEGTDQIRAVKVCFRLCMLNPFNICMDEASPIQWRVFEYIRASWIPIFNPIKVLSSHNKGPSRKWDFTDIDHE